MGEQTTDPSRSSTAPTDLAIEGHLNQVNKKTGAQRPRSLVTAMSGVYQLIKLNFLGAPWSQRFR